MAAINQKIRNKVAGDSLAIKRKYTDLDAGDQIVKAYLTFKARESDADPGILQKAIFQTGTSSGVISQPDTGVAGGVVLVFTLKNNETSLFTPEDEYLYDVQLHTADGDICTAELGDIVFLHGITDAIT